MIHRQPRDRAGFLFLLFWGAAVCAALSGCHSGTERDVGIRNDSDCLIKITFWVGQRNPPPGANVSLRSDTTLEVQPHTCARRTLGDNSGFKSASESFVRAQVRPIGASFEGDTQYWFEINPPGPYLFRMSGHSPDIKFDRPGDGDGGQGGGSLVTVPKSLWIKPSP